MKNLFENVCVMILIVSLLNACSKFEDTTHLIESTVPEHHIVTMYIEDTELVETAQQDSVEIDNVEFYSLCTNYSKSEVEQFAKEVRELILSEDWEELSDRVAYPITMGDTIYEDRASLLGILSETHLDDSSIESIRDENCSNMFCNYSGIMMGNGEVWIGEVLNEDNSSAGLWVISLNILNPA